MEEIRNQLIAEMYSYKKKKLSALIHLILSFVCCIASFILMAVMEDRTGADLFTDQQRGMDILLLLCGIVSIIFTLRFVKRHIQCVNEFQKRHRSLYQQVLRNTPIPSGNALLVLIDNRVFPTLRVTVYGYPDTDEVYYIAETVDRYYRLACVHQSKVYSSFEELDSELENFIVIDTPT